MINDRYVCFVARDVNQSDFQTAALCLSVCHRTKREKKDVFYLEAYLARCLLLTTTNRS